MNVLAVFKKELHASVASPVSYGVVAVFLVLSGYFFYSNLLMVVLFQGTNISVDVWQYSFNDMRFVMIILVPLLTMRVFAEEKRLGTIELLFTSPLKHADIILGKYGAALVILAGMLFLTMLYPVLFFLLYHLEAGPVVIGYLGLMLLGAAFLACGFFFSALTSSQIVAALTTLGVLVFFWFVDQYLWKGEHSFFNLPAALSFQKHFYNLNRGVVHTKDILYFITVSAFFLSLTFFALGLPRGRQPIVKLSGLFTARGLALNAKIMSILVIIIACNLIAVRCNRRFDLTPGNAFSLSPAAVKILADIREEIRVTVFCDIEQQYQYAELLELMAAASAHFQYSLFNLKKNPVRAAALGVHKQGAGIIEHKGSKEVVDHVTEASLISALQMITRFKQKTIGFLHEPGADQAEDHYTAVKQCLQAQGFDVKPGNYEIDSRLPARVLVLVVAVSSKDMTAEQLDALGRYFETGGKVLLLIEPARLPRIAGFLKKYNIDMGDDLVIDRENTPAELDELTPLIFLNREHPISTNISSYAVFPGARSVQVGVHPLPEYSWTILAQSGRRTWAETDLKSAHEGSAAYHSGKDIYGPVSTGVIVQQKSKTEQGASRGSMIVIGNADFAANEHAGLLANKDFFIAAVTWLARQEFPRFDLPGRKTVSAKPFIRITAAEDRLLFWTVVVIEPLMIFFIGAAVFVRRRLKR